jgi:hypothetical protein
MDPERMYRLLREKKIATMPELKEALGTEVDMSVFRKLREVGYRTSYSHRGKFYTLDEIASFDAQGLWSVAEVRFSKHGTLLRTCEALIGESAGGYFAEKLEEMLHVRVQDPLRKLLRDGRIGREELGGRSLYVAAEARQRQRQLRTRSTAAERSAAQGAVDPDELKAAIVLFWAMLNEKQRRLYAGLESLKLGPSGDRRIAEILDLDPARVRRGRRELLTREVEPERVRKAGGGRKRVEKKRRK